MKVSWEGLSHILWKNNPNVPNHQPAYVYHVILFKTVNQPLVEEHQHAANGLQPRLEGALQVIRTWEGDREREKAHT